MYRTDSCLQGNHHSWYGVIGDEWRLPDGQIKGTKNKLSMKSATKEQQCKAKKKINYFITKL